MHDTAARAVFHTAASAQARPAPRRQSRTEDGEGAAREVVQDRSQACGLPAHPLDGEQHFCPSSRTPMTTSSEIAWLSCRDHADDVPSRISRTIGSSFSGRAFQASQSVCTLRHTRLTVSLPTAPPNSAASARRTRRVLVPTDTPKRSAHRRLGPVLIGPQRLALPFRGGAIRTLQARPRHRDLGLAERPDQRPRPAAIAISAHWGNGRLRLPGATSAVPRPLQGGVEFQMDQRFDPVPDARTHAGLDGVDPIIEKPGRRRNIGLQDLTEFLLSAFMA